MLGVIKRVISGEDMQTEESDVPNKNNNNENSSNTFSEHAGATDTSDLNSNINSMASTPAVVENDQEMEVEEANLHVQHIEHNSQTPGSSLSDMSTAQAIESLAEDVEMQRARVLPSHQYQAGLRPIQFTVPLRKMEGGFPRNDSKVSSDSSSSNKGSSQNSSRDWGWFEDVHTSSEPLSSSQQKRKDSANTKDTKKGKRGPSLVPIVNRQSADDIIHNNLDNDTTAMAVTAPTYVLEESLSSQKLWKNTAGNRPPQPVEERAFFEKMWAQNFAKSNVDYQIPVEVLTAATPIYQSPFADGNFDSARGNELSNYNLSSADTPSKSQDVAEQTLISRLNEPNHFATKTVEPHQHQVAQIVKGNGSDGDLKVLIKGDNVFGTTVSKSFAINSEKGGPIVGVDTINISVASYRVVESKKHGKFAQFLVIYREGSIRDTIGVWKRYSDFQELSKKVTQAHEGCATVIANMSPLAVTEEHEVEHLPNAITSWRLLKKRQRWYRCLDAGYLSLKVFLLERFLHDILFESSSPILLRDFVGTDSE